MTLCEPCHRALTSLDIVINDFQTDPNRRRFDLNITANDVNNPIKNIRIVMPGGICTGNPFVQKRVNNANECAADKPFISLPRLCAMIVMPLYLIPII